MRDVRLTNLGIKPKIRDGEVRMRREREENKRCMIMLE